MAHSFCADTTGTSRLRRWGAVLGLLLLLLGAGGCAFKGKQEPRPLRAKEILHLVSRGDHLPLPDVTGIVIGDVGQFQERRAMLTSPDEAVLCPGRVFELTSHSRQVPAELLRGFGFSFVLKGAPQAAGELPGSRAAPLILTVEHPPLQDPVTGEVRRFEQQHIMGCIDHEGDAVFQFTSDWERVNGPWRLSLESQGRKLASVDFQVVGGREPDSAPKMTRAPGPQAPDLRVRVSGTSGAPVPPVAKAPPVAPAPQPRGERRIYVLVSSNLQPENAARDVRDLQARGFPAVQGQWRDPATGQLWHTAYLGSYGGVPQADQAAATFRQRTGRPAYVVVRREAAVQTTPPATQAPAQTTPQAPTPPVTQATPPAAAPAESGFAVQLGAYRESGNARQDAAALQARGWAVRVVLRPDSGGGRWYVLLLETHAQRAQAEAQALRFRQNEGRQAFVVAVP